MSDKPFNNPFGALQGIKDSLPKAEEKPAPAPLEGERPRSSATPQAAREGAANPTKKNGPAKAVVRMERVGRGGKEVTVIEQLDLPVKARDEWLKALKGSLGCGGNIEGTAIVLQGDQRERVPKLLEKRGVKRVIVG